MLTFIRVLLIGWLLVPVARAEQVFMTSLEWPPYSGADLADQGPVIATTRTALETMGHELTVDFFPWSRAIAMVKEADSKYVALLPEYASDDSEYVISDPIGFGPLGLLENIDKPLSWSEIDDLSAYRIGVVQDYVNTPDFDQRMAAGIIKTEQVSTDLQNIKKVAMGRVDAAVIDVNVFGYIMANNPELDQFAQVLRINSQLLAEQKSLHVWFRNDAEGQRWVGILNQGLERIKSSAPLIEHLKD